MPAGQRQALAVTSGRRRYDDVRYRRRRLVVELDGKVAHPPEARWRDVRRDNTTAVDGYRVLRYGWGDVVERPCQVGAQVVALLRQGGWRGTPRRCSPHCPIDDPPTV